MPFQYRGMIAMGAFTALLSLSVAAHAADKPKTFAICGACHKTAEGEQSILGPNLFGVVGRKAGTQPDFENYSDAMKNSGLIWTAEQLDVYLANPQDVVPGTTMAFPGLKREKARQEIIAYLESLK
jgi:cytochrome c